MDTESCSRSPVSLQNSHHSTAASFLTFFNGDRFSDDIVWYNRFRRQVWDLLRWKRVFAIQTSVETRASVVKMAMAIKRSEHFHSGENEGELEVYLERLEHFFVANRLTDGDESPKQCTWLSWAETFLCAPLKLSEIKRVTGINLQSAHFVLQKNFIVKQNTSLTGRGDKSRGEQASVASFTKLQSFIYSSLGHF